MLTKGMELVEGYLCQDNMYMPLSVLPKYSIAMVVGFLKEKSTICIHRDVEKLRSYLAEVFGLVNIT